MQNKKIAVIVTVFVILFLVIALSMGLFSHIPLIGKWIAFVLAVLLAAFVVVFFLLAGKK